MHRLARLLIVLLVSVTGAPAAWARPWRPAHVGEYTGLEAIEFELPADALPRGPAEATVELASGRDDLRHTVRFEVRAGQAERLAFYVDWAGRAADSAGLELVVRSARGPIWRGP